MLRKLFSYDFRAIGKNMWLFTIIAVVLAAVGCGSIYGFSQTASMFDQMSQQTIIPATLMTTFGMLAAVCVFGVVAYAVIGSIMILVRYYTNLFTDEGYLTFTLPVKTSTILNSKILAGIVWEIIVGIVEFTSFFAIVFTVVYCINGGYDVSSLYDIYDIYSFTQPEVTSIIGDIVVAAFDIVKLVIMVIEPLMLVYLCITLASVIVKRARIVLGIGIYSGVNTVIGTVITVLNVLISTFSYTEGGYNYYFDMIGQDVIYIVMYGGIAIGAYFLNRYLLKNKLNLT